MKTARHSAKTHDLKLFVTMDAKPKTQTEKSLRYEPQSLAPAKFLQGARHKATRKKQELLLTDHIPQLVEQVLSRAGHDAEQSRKWSLRIARSDGRSRARGHVSPRQLMDTYQGLREKVFQHLDSQIANDASIAAGERLNLFQRLGNALDEAVRDAVNSFMIERTKKLQRLARTDGLTNLYNHRTFYERLEEEIRRAKRYGSPLSVALIDLDNFKLVNDTLGHQNGDRLLKSCAEVLQRELRTTDIVCRYGGDEFAVILPETNNDKANAIFQRLPSKLAACGQNIGAPSCFGMSFGIATCPENCQAAALVHHADKLLMKNKRHHRDKKFVRLMPKTEIH